MGLGSCFACLHAGWGCAQSMEVLEGRTGRGLPEGACEKELAHQWRAGNAISNLHSAIFYSATLANMVKDGRKGQDTTPKKRQVVTWKGTQPHPSVFHLCEGVRTAVRKGTADLGCQRCDLRLLTPLSGGEQPSQA